jgi:hypothetical protein
MFDGSWNAVSNKADFIDCIAIIDRDTEEPIDISDAQDIVVQLHYPQTSEVNPIYGGYSGYYNFNGARASLTQGTVEHVEMGVFQFTFPVGIMRALPPAVYDLGVAIVTAEGITVQLIIGQVPVREGYVAMGAVA